MGVQFEAINQGLDQYGPWHFRDVRFQQEPRSRLEAALLHAASAPVLNERLREISRDYHGTSRACDETLLAPKAIESTDHKESDDAVPSATSPPPSIPFTKPYSPVFPATTHPSLCFPLHRHLGPESQAETFHFSSPSRPRPCLKRRRPPTDVDGPNSASLPCKKRRLLRQLITSRLSQPFSLPATHILNRGGATGATGGDKRLSKLTVMMVARRLTSSQGGVGGAGALTGSGQVQQPHPSTWLRRAAVLNSLRKRVYAEAAEKGMKILVVNGTMQQQQQHQHQQHGPRNLVMGGRYVLTDAANLRSLPHHQPNQSGLRLPPYLLNSSSSTAASLPALNIQIRPPIPSSSPLPASSTPSNPTAPPPSTTTTATTTTTAAAAAAAAAATTRLRIPSPQLRPLRSPELRVTRLPPLPRLDEDDDDDDGPGTFHDRHLDIHHRHHEEDPDGDGDGGSGFAFPTSELESRYMLDPEDEDGAGGEGAVYADFSVIFGGGGGVGSGGGEGEDEEGDFEDYMDDLDGIPWGARF
ncbi:hypothetical protein VTK26DRAFT_998 [Humicola hyalothermophila]